MNIPFDFALNTTTTIYGRILSYAAPAAGYDTNRALIDITGAAGLGADAAARLTAAGLRVPTTKFWIVGFSLTAWYSADIGVRAAFGLYDTANTVFIPLYPTVATGVKAGGIQKTFNLSENGIYVPQSATLLPCVAVFKQTATDGDVRVSGDIAIITERA